MSILQINLWCCEICDNTESTTEWLDVYCDPTVLPPPAWANGLQWQDVENPSDEVCGLLACPTCVEHAKATESGALLKYNESVIGRFKVFAKKQESEVLTWGKATTTCFGGESFYGKEYIKKLKDILDEANIDWRFLK